MKKLLLLTALLIQFGLARAQNVPDVIRTSATPATGANKNNRSQQDANLYIPLSFRIPRATAFTLNGAKDSIGYLMFNTTSNRFGVYQGSGVWQTYSTTADTYKFTGTSLQYTKGDGTYATFPTGADFILNQMSSPQLANIYINGEIFAVNAGALITLGSGALQITGVGSAVYSTNSIQLHSPLFANNFFINTPSDSTLINSTAKITIVAPLTLFTDTLRSETAPVNPNDVVRLSDLSALAPVSGSGNYIQNQNASPQTADYNITGNGYIKTSLGIGNENVTNGRVRIGNGFNSDAYDNLGISDTSSRVLTAPDNMINAENRYTAPGDLIYRVRGGKFVALVNPNGYNLTEVGGGVMGEEGVARIEGPGNVTAATGVYSRVVIDSVGGHVIAANAYAAAAVSPVAGSLVDNGIGINLPDQANAGQTTVTNVYNAIIGGNWNGLGAQAPSDGASGRWSLYDYSSYPVYFHPNVGFGIGLLPANITARIQIASQTVNAGTAPLKLTTGTSLMITPEQGAIEYLDPTLYFTNASGRNKFELSNTNDFLNNTVTQQTSANSNIDGSYTTATGVAVGSVSSLNGYNIWASKSITGGGGGVDYGIRSDGQLQSDVTTFGRLFFAQANTAPASFTVANINLFEAGQGTIGSGSSVTTLAGFVAGSSLKSGTNNYGFYGNLAYQASSFNTYNMGTAPNYFAGNVNVGSNVQTALFYVRQPTFANGTISTTTTSGTITGIGTTFLSTFSIGQTITANGETHTITAIASNLSMTTDVWTNTNTSVAYTLVGGNVFAVNGNKTITMYGYTSAGILHNSTTGLISSSLLATADFGASIALPSTTTATTQTALDNSTKIATTAYADALKTATAILTNKTFDSSSSTATPAFSATALTLINNAYILTASDAVVSITTGVNTGATGTTVLYTVPTGKTLTITKIITRVTSSSSPTTGPTINVYTVAAGDIYNSTSLGAMTTVPLVFTGYTTGVSRAAIAAGTINYQVTAAANAAQTCTVTLYGTIE